ncbi:MAG: hypothetical protein PHW31_04205 [Candidatus Pacebacteria bacterium]|nr:hypothetical protein [Candidatus Paceibacterota bacterium]
MVFSEFFFRKISSFASLMIVAFIAFVLGAIIIHQSQKLAELQKPLPLYVKIQEAINADY